jgi:hypothetical protein
LKEVWFIMIWLGKDQTYCPEKIMDNLLLLNK